MSSRKGNSSSIPTSWSPRVFYANGVVEIDVPKGWDWKNTNSWYISKRRSGIRRLKIYCTVVEPVANSKDQEEPCSSFSSDLPVGSQAPPAKTVSQQSAKSKIHKHGENRRPSTKDQEDCSIVTDIDKVGPTTEKRKRHKDSSKRFQVDPNKTTTPMPCDQQQREKQEQEEQEDKEEQAEEDDLKGQARAKKPPLSSRRVDKRRKISTTRKKKSEETRKTIDDPLDVQTTSYADRTLSLPPLNLSTNQVTVSAQYSLSVDLQPDSLTSLPIRRVDTEVLQDSAQVTDGVGSTDNVGSTDGVGITDNVGTTDAVGCTNSTTDCLDPIPTNCPVPTRSPPMDSASPQIAKLPNSVGKDAYDKKLWKNAVRISEEDLPEGLNTMCYPYEFYLDEEELKKRGCFDTEEKIQLLLRDFWTRWNLWDGLGNSAEPGKHILVCYPYAQLPVDKDGETFHCQLHVEPTKGNLRVKGPWTMTNDKQSGPGSKPAKSASGFWKKYLRRVMGNEYDEKLKPELSNDPHTNTTNDVYRVNRVFVQKQDKKTGQYEYYHVPTNAIITSSMAIKQGKTKKDKRSKKSGHGSSKRQDKTSSLKSQHRRSANFENSSSESESDDPLSEDGTVDRHHHHPASYETALVPPGYYAYQHSGSQPYNSIGQTVNDRFYPFANQSNGYLSGSQMSSYCSPPATPIHSASPITSALPIMSASPIHLASPIMSTPPIHSASPIPNSFGPNGTPTVGNGYHLPLANMQDPTLLTLTPMVSAPPMSESVSNSTIGNEDIDDDDMDEEEQLAEGMEQHEWAMSEGSDES